MEKGTKNEMKKNQTIGIEQIGFGYLKSKPITEIRTQLGYLLVLEYILQDYSYLHVVQWHFNNNLEEGNLIPKVNCETFHKEKDKALKLAHEIGNNLLQQYDIP